MYFIVTLLFNSGLLLLINLYQVYLFSNYILVACEGAGRDVSLQHSTCQNQFPGKF